MYLWAMYLQVRRPLPGFPRPQVVACERQDRPSYHHAGRDRQGERHCLFKATLRGEGRFRDALGEHRLPPGTAFLCRIRDPATSYYYPADGREPWEFVWCCFVDGPSEAMVDAFTARHGAVHRLPAERGLLRDLLTWRGAGPSPALIEPAAGARMVADLFACLESCHQERPAGGDDLCRRAMATARERIGQRLDAASLAALCGVSREHLSRCFREQVGMPPYRWLLRQRMLEACRALKQDRRPVRDLARRLGYDDPAHFNRAFLRVIGQTPRRFRDHGVVPLE